jgi:hypothetical protein
MFADVNYKDTRRRKHSSGQSRWVLGSVSQEVKLVNRLIRIVSACRDMNRLALSVQGPPFRISSGTSKDRGMGRCIPIGGPSDRDSVREVTWFRAESLLWTAPGFREVFKPLHSFIRPSFATLVYFRSFFPPLVVIAVDLKQSSVNDVYEAIARVFPPFGPCPWSRRRTKSRREQRQQRQQWPQWEQRRRQWSNNCWCDDDLWKCRCR